MGGISCQNQQPTSKMAWCCYRATVETYQSATILSRNDSHYDNFGIPINSRKIADLNYVDF